jgi:DNA-binding NtrC family response regulator
MSLPTPASRAPTKISGRTEAETVPDQPLDALFRDGVPEIPAKRAAAKTIEISAESAGLRDQLEEMERQRIIGALEECGGNQTRAARMLGMSRKALINRLDRYNIPRPRKRSSDP